MKGARKLKLYMESWGGVGREKLIENGLYEWKRMNE